MISNFDHWHIIKPAFIVADEKHPEFVAIILWAPVVQYVTDVFNSNLHSEK